MQYKLVMQQMLSAHALISHSRQNKDNCLGSGTWKRKLEAVEGVLFLWKRKRKRENPTASA